MLRPLLSTHINVKLTHIGLLIFRLWIGITMMPHGYAKMLSFAEKKDKFMAFAGMDGSLALRMVIFAELFCSVLIALGLLTRLALIPLIITFMVVVFKAHEGDIFGDGETGFIYLACYVLLLFTGPGRYSIDYFIFGNRNKML